ncbi:MAG: hypothetical protein ACI9LO_001342 [Planctomycetota bacterium]|jgi:hypothetical protein
MSKPFFILLLISLWPGLATAELYKWVDKQGNTHYSDKPPVQNKYKEIGPAAKGDPAEAKRLRERTRKLLQEQQRIDHARTQAEINRKKQNKGKRSPEAQCTIYKAERKFFKRSGKHSVIDADGNTKKVDKAERKIRLAELDELIAETCDE